MKDYVALKKESDEHRVLNLNRKDKPYEGRILSTMRDCAPQMSHTAELQFVDVSERKV